MEVVDYLETEVLLKPVKDLASPATRKGKSTKKVGAASKATAATTATRKGKSTKKVGAASKATASKETSTTATRRKGKS